MHEKIEKVKKELEDVEQLKKSIFEKTKMWFEATDVSSIDAKEFSEIIDTIKDLSEVCKYCWEALYFEASVKGMEDLKQEKKKEEEEMKKAGYDNWRYPSSGRFAPTGSGTFYGYPFVERFGYPIGQSQSGQSGAGNVQTGYGMNGFPGYNGSSGGGSQSSGGSSGGRGLSGSYGGSGGSQGGSSGRSGYEGDPRYGRAYNQYQSSKRGYNETHDEGQRKEMNQHAKEHFEETLVTFRDIWHDVDPEQKRKMKMDLQALIGELG